MSDRIESLFHQASDLPPDQRRVLLDVVCKEDPGLRAEVERLLSEDDRLRAEAGASAFLDSPVVRFLDAGGAPRVDGRGPGATWRAGVACSTGLTPAPLQIVDYRIIRLLGEGGMGAVYEAEQDSPRRPVALKVVRPGLASPALLKRFAHEAQILARLHHPGIAQVYEAGLADDGQPFFAMEFIRGLPLDGYADRHGLDLAARVGLVARVCDAVHHAHEKGVIHRDLKPANILVEETGQPKVLDFGVARTTDADQLTAAGLTLTGQLLGTPKYMSPEQVDADHASIDHRADVYALGVILFELVARRLPYLLEDRPLAEAVRLILEQDPPRLGSLNPELRGDVETIVAKALEKDPSRRYSSAADLAADLRRWMAHEPIRARPPSALYHLGKFARRNRTLVGGAAATGAALVLGLVGTVLFAVGEARQRGEAERNARAAISEKREAMFQGYRARLAAAAAALTAHDVADASQQLAEAPEDLRGWEWRHLHSRLDDSESVIPLPAGGGGILIPGSGRLRVGVVSRDGLRLTDLDGGESVTVLIRPQEPQAVDAVETRQGLRVFALAGRGVDVFDVAGRRLRRLDLLEDAQARVAVSADGTRLAWPRSIGGRGRLTLCDAPPDGLAAAHDGHLGHIWSFAFSPDGTRLASAGEDRTVRVWDPATGAALVTCRGHENKVLRVMFSPDGKRLLTTSADGTARQWDVATGREIEPPYDRHSGNVTTAVYSPDGLRVASAGSDRTVRVWEAKGRRDLAILHGHTGNVTGVAFAPEGHRLASLSGVSALNIAGDGTIRGWDVDPQATLPALRGHTAEVYPVAFSPDGRWIASGSWDKTIRLWDAATGEPCAVLPHPDVVHDLAFGPDATWLVSACLADNRLRIWDVATARLLREITVPGGKVRSVTIPPDGRRLAATSNPAQSDVFYVHVCDIQSGERLYSAEGGALAYSPDGRWLAVRDADTKTVLLLDAQTHEIRVRLRGHERLVWSAAFSPDGRRLATCSQDRTVRVWPVNGGACQVFRGHTDEVFAAAFHPDGTRLASAGRDRAVWLWDLARGEEVARLQGHAGYVWDLAFSPDGATLASGSGDFTVRLWDTAPLRARYRARRDTEALRPEAERLVAKLCREKDDLVDVAKTLRTDRQLGEPLRQQALRALLRRAQPPEAVPSDASDRP